MLLPFDQRFESPFELKCVRQAGKKLVVLEVDSLDVCQTGLKEEAELHWKVDKQNAAGPCQELKHLLQRTARDCPDVHFVHLDVRTHREDMTDLYCFGVSVTFFA